jgi:hypothetical protein
LGGDVANAVNGRDIRLMTDVADYDTDILLWSERQAALLRELGARVRGLPNDLDLENVAEEIESVGRTEFRAAESFLLLILQHAIKAAAAASPEPVPHWLAEIRTFHDQHLSAVTPAMRRRFDLDRLWAKARKRVSEDRADIGEAPLVLPDACPFDIAFFDDESFDARTLVDRLATIISAHVEPSTQPGLARRPRRGT